MDGPSRLFPNAVSAGAAAMPAEPHLAQSAPCLIVNPRSFGASRRGLAERAAEIARQQGCAVVQATDAATIGAAIDRLVLARQRTIALLGGDGTVQVAAERLARVPADLPQPQLLVLGGGRSNVTAADVGGCGDVLKKLETTLRQCRAGATLRTQTRPTLAISQGAGPVRHAFLLAGGLLDYAIRACHRHRRQGGSLRTGGLGTTWALAKVGLPAMLGLSEPPLDALRIEAPGAQELAQPARWLLLTTLRNGLGSVDPFAPRGAGAIRCTAITAQGPSFWARLPRLAAGRFTPAMDAAHGYLSTRCDALRVRGLSSYTLDGEPFTADPARPVEIGLGATVTFIQP
jgi:hypothetical protein